MHKSSMFTSMNSHRGNVCNQHSHQETEHHPSPRSPTLPPSCHPTHGALDAELMVWFSVGTENTAHGLMGFNAEKQTNKQKRVQVSCSPGQIEVVIDKQQRVKDDHEMTHLSCKSVLICKTVNNGMLGIMAVQNMVPIFEDFCKRSSISKMGNPTVWVLVSNLVASTEEK